MIMNGAAQNIMELFAALDTSGKTEKRKND